MGGMKKRQSFPETGHLPLSRRRERKDAHQDLNIYGFFKIVLDASGRT